MSGKGGIKSELLTSRTLDRGIAIGPVRVLPLTWNARILRPRRCRQPHALRSRERACLWAGDVGPGPAVVPAAPLQCTEEGKAETGRPAPADDRSAHPGMRPRGSRGEGRAR